MKEYVVKYWYEFHLHVKVKANSEEEAMDKVKEKLTWCSEASHPNQYNEYQNERLEIKG